MRRRHRMPFGAEVRDDGRVRFRLWAPAAREVDLCLMQGHAEEILSMKRGRRGWFEILTTSAKAGSRYRFRIDRDRCVPDPASRFNPDGVHGASEVIDPAVFDWQDAGWRGRAWEEAVIYELHVGTFSAQGTFRGVQARLDYLVDLGVTAIELMPVADFPGARNWGYDGVLPFAPARCYGRPEDLKQLVQGAHARGLMVLLDVVYNHFGPEGNYLPLYAPRFFTERHRTPWGAAIDFALPDGRAVRDFFIHNALYWLEEFNVDGLRLDAVHAIADDFRPHVLEELAEAVQHGPGRERPIHLVLENDDNAARYLVRDQDGHDGGQAARYRAQWNDDIHHALHVLLTGETDGYYRDYGDRPARQLARCLTEGFAFQGEASVYRQGATRGEPSRDLPPTVFVSLLQSHDQVGNRAFGERIGTLADARAVRTAVSVILMAPSPPLLFMGEEFGAATPFLFFCDFGPELATAVTEGRRREFARFARFADSADRDRIPDPNREDAFVQSRLDWGCLGQPVHREWLAFYRELLQIRREHIVSRLHGIRGGMSQARVIADRALAVDWVLGDGSRLGLRANFGHRPVAGLAQPAGFLLFASPRQFPADSSPGMLPALSAAWWLDAACGGH